MYKIHPTNKLITLTEQIKEILGKYNITLEQATENINLLLALDDDDFGKIIDIFSEFQAVANLYRKSND